jgi:hypothetical protein
MHAFSAFACSLVAFGAVASAQQPGKPLGELLESLPPPEAEAREAVQPATARPAPPPRSGVGTIELPPSQPARIDAPEAVPAVDAKDPEALEDPEAVEAAVADAAWADLQEQRRAEINAVESPIVDRLNAQMVQRQQAFERQVAEERAAHERRVAAHAAEVRRLEAEHRAALERHRAEEERLRALYQACLAGDEAACAALP